MTNTPQNNKLIRDCIVAELRRKAADNAQFEVLRPAPDMADYELKVAPIEPCLVA